MPHKDDLLEELDWISDKISSQIWTLNLGILGTTWSLLVTSTSISEAFRFRTSDALPLISLCILALVAQMLQYLSGYITARQNLQRLELQRSDEFKYDKTGFFYRLREWCFQGKSVLTLLAAAWLITTLVRKLL